MSLHEEQIKVLIVEDDFRVAEINATFIGRIEGYQVVGKAVTGCQAQALLGECRPDLVLLDIYLPDMLGTELLWQIRQHHRSTDVIMLTAATESETVQQALRGGAVDYILKPILFERLESTLTQYRRYRSQLRAGGDFSSQEQVDQLFARGLRPGPLRTPGLPKGIDPLTLEKVTALLKESGEGLTAEETGSRIGVSRSTARRYLEYLIAGGQAAADLAYGTVGRPERRYLPR